MKSNVCSGFPVWFTHTHTNPNHTGTLVRTELFLERRQWHSSRVLRRVWGRRKNNEAGLVVKAAHVFCLTMLSGSWWTVRKVCGVRAFKNVMFNPPTLISPLCGRVSYIQPETQNRHAGCVAANRLQRNLVEKRSGLWNCIWGDYSDINRLQVVV